MWKLLKAEIYYNKNLLLVFSTLIIVTIVLDMGQINNIRAMLLQVIPSFFIVTKMFTRQTIEKRERYYSILPVSNVRIAALRLTLLYLPFASMVIFYFIYGSILMRFFGDYLQYVGRLEFNLFSNSTLWFGFMGLYILGFLFYLILHDINTKTKKVNRSFSINKYYAMVTLMLLIIWVISTAKERDGNFIVFIITNLEIVFEFLLSQYGVLTIHLLALIFAGISVITFQRRTSFISN